MGLTFNLPKKLVNSEPALFANEFNHEFDIVFESMNGGIEGTAKHACIPAVIDYEEFGVQPFENLVWPSGGHRVIRRLRNFRR